VKETTFPTPEQISIALDPRSFYLMVLPTEDCNFRCAYCYEDHTPGKMSPETVAGIKKLIECRMNDLHYFGLSWFGGEPLLAKEIVFDLCEHAQQCSREHGVKLLHGKMVTNAYFLTPPVAERLVGTNQKHFHITLDGYGLVHDRTRPHASGRGTFERIWSNLTTLRESKINFRIDLRIHYGAAKLQETEEICRRVNKHFGGDIRFRVLLQRIANLGGKNKKKIVPLPIDEAKRTARHLTSFLSDIDFSDPETAEGGICYAARPNHLLIRTDGRISKCAVNLKDPRNIVGSLDADGHLRTDSKLFQLWLQGFKDFDHEILTCPYKVIRCEPVPGSSAKTCSS
jgi:uncharacterized protein